MIELVQHKAAQSRWIRVALVIEQLCSAAFPTITYQQQPEVPHDPEIPTWTSSRLQAALMSSSTASSRGLSSSGDGLPRGLTACRRLCGRGGTLRGDNLLVKVVSFVKT